MQVVHGDLLAPRDPPGHRQADQGVVTKTTSPGRPQHDGVVRLVPGVHAVGHAAVVGGGEARVEAAQARTAPIRGEHCTVWTNHSSPRQPHAVDAEHAVEAVQLGLGVGVSGQQPRHHRHHLLLH